jgi:1-acyl-sn-glycerol-3-phosphate acyltransferase
VPASYVMAELKPQVYKDPRPAEYFTPFHERARRRGPDAIYDIARIVLTPPTLLFYRAAAIGVDNVPPSGPVILAPNHFSQWDHFFAGVYLRRKIRFMAKSQLFANPAIEFIFRHGGVFPVRRGHSDEEAFITAHAILDSGGCLLMYAEGGRSRTGRLGSPRPGVGRLALESGVPVVPVAIHGSLGVRGWKRLRFPKVTVQYDEPMTFDVVENPTREQQLEVAESVFDRVRAMYVGLEEQGRWAVIKALRKGLPAGSPADASARTQSQ